MLKKIIWSIVIIVFLFAIVSIFLVFDWGRNSRRSAVDFVDCVNSGFAVMESYPRQCRDGMNKVFSEDVGNTLAKADLIYLISPKPNEDVHSPIHLTGKARGVWFFEASFPVRIKTSDGKILATGIAKATGDWMTNEFVDFTSDLYFRVSTTTRAVLELTKDNPSNQTSLEDSLVVPVLLQPLTASTTKQQ